MNRPIEFLRSHWRTTRFRQVSLVIVVLIAGSVFAIYSEHGLAFSNPPNRVFFPLFELVYPLAIWFLLSFLALSIGSLAYAVLCLVRRSKIDINSVQDATATSDRLTAFMIIALTALFAIPFAITRSQYSLPGGDTVAYIGMANQFLHYGIGWLLFNDSRPFVDIVFALISVVVGLFGIGAQATYLVSSSVLTFVSITLMMTSSFLLLRRSGFDQLTVFIGLLLTLASVETFQLNGGTYANSLAFSLLYLSIYILDKALFSQGLRQILLLSILGTIAALTHVQTFGLSSLVLIFSAAAISMKLPPAIAKIQLTRVLLFLSIELILLSPFIGLALFDTHYFGAFSTYLGNVRGRYFAAFPGLASPTPPIAFDQTALYSLAVQYGNMPVYFALAASFPILAFRFQKPCSSRADVYALVWAAMAIIGSTFVYASSLILPNPTFDGPLLARRFLFLLPLPLLYSITVDYLRRPHL